MRVLVTGAAGMLGSNLVKSMTDRAGIEVTGLKRTDVDLRSRDAFTQILDSVRPDVVIHAAAKVGGIEANVRNPFEFLVDNILMDSNVIQSSIDAGIQNFMYIGSSCMYPKNFRQPLVESDILAGPLEPTNEGYAIAKITGSKLCELASASFGINYKTIIPSSLYGPGDNFNLGSSHLVASIIRKVHNAKATSATEIEVWGNGLARREFTYVQDLAGWIIESLPRISSLPSVLNLGIGVDYSVNEFYEFAMEALGFEAKLVHDSTKPEGMMAKLMSSERARAGFGWSPQTNLVHGIQKTYKWFVENEASIARL